MNNAYIITNDELAERGLDLNEYALEGTFINAIITNALDIAVSRVCFLNDSFYSEDDIEEDLDKDQKKVKAFKKLQYRVIYNLIFTTEDSPIDQSIDSIIAHQLNIGKINGVQKGLYYRHN